MTELQDAAMLLNPTKAWAVGILLGWLRAVTQPWDVAACRRAARRGNLGLVLPTLTWGKGSLALCCAASPSFPPAAKDLVAVPDPLLDPKRSTWYLIKTAKGDFILLQHLSLMFLQV